MLTIYLYLLFWFITSISFAILYLKFIFKYTISDIIKNLNKNINKIFLFLFLYFTSIIIIQQTWFFNILTFSSLSLVYLLIIIEESFKTIFLFKNKQNESEQKLTILLFAWLFWIFESILYYFFNIEYFLQHLFILFLIRFWINIILHISYSYFIYLFYKKDRYLLWLLIISLMHLWINIGLWNILNNFV